MRPSARSVGAAVDGGSVRERLLSRRALVLLVRNTVVSCGAFGVGLVVLWLLVEQVGTNKINAGAASFITANSLHYLFGRTWIYRGTEREAVSGYAFFLVNGLIGMVVTLVMYAALMAVGMHYIAARIVASVFAGLLMFLLNAFLNFRML
jgi:putative flippase GtrA